MWSDRRHRRERSTDDRVHAEDAVRACFGTDETDRDDRCQGSTRSLIRPREVAIEKYETQFGTAGQLASRASGTAKEPSGEPPPSVGNVAATLWPRAQVV